jgi:hypothetical protein
MAKIPPAKADRMVFTFLFIAISLYGLTNNEFDNAILKKMIFFSMLIVVNGMLKTNEDGAAFSSFNLKKSRGTGRHLFNDS